MTVSEKLIKLRSLFLNIDVVGSRGPIHAYVLPRTDAHQSEYISDRDSRVEFISGFSGSNAYVIITENEALLWTDGRYYIQAPKEFEDGWSLMKWGESNSIEPLDWLLDNVSAGSAVGFDPNLFGYSEGKTFVEKLENGRMTALPIETNLVDLIWDSRPPEELKKVISLKPTEHGESSNSKVERIRDKLRKRKCDAIVLTSLDDIAWTLNLRGSDIPFNPLFFSITVITLDEVHLFVNEQKIEADVAGLLTFVKISPYESAGQWLKEYHSNGVATFPQSHRIWIPDSTNYFIASIVNSNYAFIDNCPVQSMKAIKNDTELAGMRFSSVRDSAAIVQFLVWLRRELDLGHLVDEMRAGNQIDYYRSCLPDYVSPSFETISACDDHSALPHYKPDQDSGKRLIKRDSVYLVDSGGQYRDGTTDVTRTVVHCEEVDEHVRKMFTLVLKCHIDLATLKFPSGINANRIDALSRQALWDEGYDFGHGVGHGVGHFLNVHQSPPYVGYRRSLKDGGIYSGMVFTIEPGYYEEGNFGIRIENCYEVIEAKGLSSGAANFLQLSPLTLVPIQKSLIKRELLETKHIQWLNNYHNRCLEILGKYLQEQRLQEEYNFLAEACTPI